MTNLANAKWFIQPSVREGVGLHVLQKCDGPDLWKWLRVDMSNAQSRSFNLDSANADPAIKVIYEPYSRYKINGTKLRGFDIEVNNESAQSKFDLSIANRNPTRPAPIDADLRLHNFLLYVPINELHPTKPVTTLN